MFLEFSRRKNLLLIVLIMKVIEVEEKLQKFKMCSKQKRSVSYRNQRSKMIATLCLYKREENGQSIDLVLIPDLFCFFFLSARLNIRSDYIQRGMIVILLILVVMLAAIFIKFGFNSSSSSFSMQVLRSATVGL